MVESTKQILYVMKSDISITVNSYWKLLENLSSEVKLRLIAKLSQSLVKPAAEEEKEKTNWADEFYGAWDDSRTAEEIIDDIKNSRVFNRHITSFQ